mmetsp:Transcript_19072/g.26840  ORF Transcript_19072/g.26840 Transcript_19072/m.26840 type:complete len:520 (+) Transcript_19072:35-1594(+)
MGLGCCPHASTITKIFTFLKNMDVPWTPLYAQSNKSGNVSTSESFTATWTMALTVLFTVAVFAFEHYLDERQADAYKKTDFPLELEDTVGKIDSEKVPDVKKDANGEGDKSSGASDEKTDSSKLDKDKPILPQLKEKFDKSQKYGTDKIVFGMIQSFYGVVETVVFLLMGFMPYFWDLSVNFGEQYFGWNESENEIKISLIFLAITSLLATFTGIPWELYSTFKIEKKHGFNKQTLGLFFSDKVKSTLLGFVFGGPFVALLLKIIDWGGEYFYLYVWAFTFLFSAFMMTIVPVFIMPLFNKYEPLQDGELKTRIYALADKLKYPLTKLFVMDGSKRSSHSNAFMFGFGKNKRIVLFDTLLDQVDDDEILAILGHELGHWKLGHTLTNFAITQIYFGAAFFFFSLCFTSDDLYRAFGFDDTNRSIPTIIALTFFFQTVWAPVDKILSFCLTLFSRKCEFQADEFSANLGMAKKLQTGLCKISLENLGAMCPDPFYAMYHYSHPPLVERLSAMINMEKKTK